ncbi:hypothetical protein ACKTKD_003838 [Clostridioides difficile]|uniref:hypothetical protein n=1 Tax=Clostridioides sp. ES-S-0001-03 TaxID=2770771 RepID=UPI001C157917|nr:hypothetical protein [Clostridioides difficile]MCC0654886.1 hypothetical protein [Clostridioides sp. ES-S-0001-03]EKS6826034.1 hypothetical protein [Clostridioides difficile]MCZ8510814.1 hypothetical protein [Clostridioides difficile]MDN9967512.1 hypothetical protein [Clostridioides difficile]
MKRNFLPNLALVISVISMVLVILKLLGVIKIPIVIINLLFITLLSVMTWINYRNNKKVQMFIGVLVLLVFIGLILL